MRLALLVASLLVSTGTASCHLADDPEVKCPAGQHVELGRCMLDDPTGIVMTLAASCSVTPASVTTKVDGLFRFKNDDQVDHVVRGQDGQTWATAKAGQYSDYVGLVKAGTWPFDVDACKKAGTVVVE